MSISMSEWVNNFLTAHQHIIGYSVPTNGIAATTAALQTDDANQLPNFAIEAATRPTASH